MKRELNRWLKKPGNSESKLAEILGFSSVSAIYNWKKRGVPKYLQPMLKDFFNDKISIDNFEEIYGESIS